MVSSPAREAFEAAAKATQEIATIDAERELLLSGIDTRCKGEKSGHASGTSDPVVAALLRTEHKLARLAIRRMQLEADASYAFELVVRVRVRLGDVYADVLELYYLQDVRPLWREVASELHIGESTARMYRDSACNYLDSWMLCASTS